MKRVLLVAGCLGWVIAPGCAGTPDAHDQSVFNETTLTRFEGSAIAREELEAVRPSAIATAITIERIEKALREPWAEQREPYIFLEHLSNEYPSDTGIAMNLWESGEPPGRGQGRAIFRELGFYRNNFMPASFGAGVRPPTLEAMVATMMREHSDVTPELSLLAAWRRFSPNLSGRRENYLSSHWEFRLDYVSPVRIAVNESLLGPHVRSEVIDTGGVSFPGQTETVEGYTAPAVLIDLLMPVGESPVRPAVEALYACAHGAPTDLPCGVSRGPSHSNGELDGSFLRTALKGLMRGTADLEAVPGAADKLTVTFSYLLDDAEARSTLCFVRDGRRWTLTRFDYEPAAASMINGSVTLDLMPILRAKLTPDRPD